jgi:3-hydroxyisobutyrate dehydrogenase-like beta-hydroxyacid dehydrogenase
MTRVAFIGLGVMGYPMAGHLAAAGHDVTVYNRTATVAARWIGEHDGRSASTPAAAADGAEVVLTCVGDDDDVRAGVVGDDGVLAAMAEGTVLVDHTTASADLARELHAAGAERGVAVIDAPISGGQAGAENGRLTVMCGGDAEPFERVAPILGHYGAAVTLLGPSGSGQLTKMVNQLCIAGAVQGLAEGLAFGRRAGLDMDLVLDVVGKGAAGSWQMENRGRTMVREEYDFGFAVDWMRKDLAICLAEARRSGARAPVAALVDQLYAQVQARGGRRWDTSSLIDLLLRD